MKDSIEHQALVCASMGYLTDPLPSQEVWDGYSIEQQYEFLTTHAWEAVEDNTGTDLFYLIDCHADSILQLLKQHAPTTLPDKLREAKVGIFAEKDSCDDALKFALSLFAGEGRGDAVTVAIMVYHNTLIEALAKQVEAENQQ